MIATPRVAAIVTVGDELVSGNSPNANATYLAARLESLAIEVGLAAVVPDRVPLIARLVRDQAVLNDYVFVTGGLGGTPDDVTREAIASAFAVPVEAVPALAALLSETFDGDLVHIARWALLPAGSRVLASPLGGAAGFVLKNVYVLPGTPEEARAIFETIVPELERGVALASWRCVYATTESRIAPVLDAFVERYPGVRLGSYPAFDSDGPRVELVLRASTDEELRAAAAWLSASLAAHVGELALPPAGHSTRR